MRNRYLAIAASSAVALVTLTIIDQVGCQLRGGCIEDDASIRASFLQLPLALAYAAGSWIIVYPTALLLARRINRLTASLLVSFGFGLIGSVLLHRPEVDGAFAHTLSVLLPWLALPWLFGCFIALALWPAAGKAQPVSAPK